MPTIKERAIHIQQLLDRMPVWKKDIDDKAVVTGDKGVVVPGEGRDKKEEELEEYENGENRGVVASFDDNESSISKIGDDTKVAEDLKKVELRGNGGDEGDDDDGDDNDDDEEEDDSNDRENEDYCQETDTEGNATDSPPKCPFCLNLKPDGNEHLGLYDKWKLKSRANLGCPTCPVIEDARSELITYSIELFKSRGAIAIPYIVELHTIEKDKSLELEFDLRIREANLWTWHTSVMKLYIHEGQPTPYNNLPISMLEQVSMPKRFERTRAWIDDCVSNHQTCGNHNPLPVLPHRVLDIRRFSETGLIDLIEASDMRGMYACLSYCWGTDNEYVTTFDNLDAMMIDVPWARLPQTYKDAVVVASELKIPFLWVDALCIIQGQRERPETLKDWEEQSAMMSSIYGQAYLTIAATNGNSVHEGFLGRCRFESLSFKSPLRLEGSSAPIYVYGRRIFDHSSFEPRKSAPYATTPSFLNVLRSRAWCFQEHCLSTRVLSFGNDEVVFDCNSGSRCECGEYTEQEVKAGGQNFENQDARWVLSHGNMDTMSWSVILNEYVHRIITFPADTLPAASGIARMFQEKMKVAYLAGHWDDSGFIASLSWWVSGNVSPERRDMPYLAPSWSWAVVRSAEVEQRTAWNLVCDPSARPGSQEIVVLPDNCVIEKRCFLASNDPTGAVVAGYLIVRGFSLEAELNLEGTWPYVTRNGIDLLEVALDRPMARKNYDIQCWYVGWKKSTGDDGTYSSTHSMMILQRTVNRVYRRIGWLTLVDGVEDLAWRNQFVFLEGYKDCLTCFAIT